MLTSFVPLSASALNGILHYNLAMTADSEKDILNFYHPNDRRTLNEGLFLAYIHRAIAAQFEHTIVVTRNEPIILTL